MNDPHTPPREPTEAEVQAMVDQALNDVPLPMDAEQEYDSIMGEINQELTTANIGSIAATVAAETPEQKALRAQRYTKDFAEFEKRMGARGGTLSAQLSKHYRTAFASLEQKTKAAEAQEVARIEASFNQAA